MVSKLVTGFVQYFEEFDDSLPWQFIPIERERRFPFRFRTNVDGRTFEIAFRMNPVELIHDGSGTEYRRLFIKIMDYDNDNEVLYENVVTQGLMMKIADLYLYFAEITLKEENMLYSKDYGTVITIGVALEYN